MVYQVGDGQPDGVNMGRSATVEKISFYDATPVIQPTSGDQAAVSTSTPIAGSNFFAFATTAQFTAIITLVNRLRLDLVNLGLINGS